jgi:nucleotide-binding universal stress UspA family protein
MAARGRGKRGFDVVVASDGSAPARAAVATTAGFCWPAGAKLHAVAVRELGLDLGGPAYEELEAVARAASHQALRVLARRGPGASAEVLEAPVGPAILAYARHLRARAIVVGTRGHGPLRRMVLGSASRFVVREARCPVLVVRERASRGQRVVLGIDGSAPSLRAAAFLASLEPARGARISVIAAIEPLRLPSLGRLPSGVRATLRAEARALADEKHAAAQRRVNTAARKLEAAGWNVRADVREGVPLETLLARAASERADLLAVGARGTGGVRRWLLGSVAEGVLQHAPCAVLVVR